MFKFIPSVRIALMGVVGILGFCLAGVSSPLLAQESGGNFCSQLLDAHPEGGDGLAAEVQTLAAAAPEVAEDVLGCAGSANKAQAKALGVGLAKVVDGLKVSDPALADKIAALVAGSENETLKVAYAGGSSEEATAAIDGGGAGDNGGAPAGDTAAFGDTPAAFGSGPAAPVLTVGSSGGGTGGGSVSPN